MIRRATCRSEGPSMGSYFLTSCVFWTSLKSSGYRSPITSAISCRYPWSTTGEGSPALISRSLRACSSVRASPPISSLWQYQLRFGQTVNDLPLLLSWKGQPPTIVPFSWFSTVSGWYSQTSELKTLSKPSSIASSFSSNPPSIQKCRRIWR